MEANKQEPSKKITPKKAMTAKKKKGYLLINLAAMLIFVVILIGLTFYGMNTYTRHGEEVTVPNLKGLTGPVAIQKLTEAGLLAKIEDSVYVKSLPPNVVYEQSTQAGERVKANRIIYLTLNSGNAPQLILPDIADNSSLREATAKLTASGFKLAPVEYIEGEKDWVYEVKCNGRTLSAGSCVDVNDELVLVVGDGSYYGDGMEDVDGENLEAESYEDFTEDSLDPDL